MKRYLLFSGDLYYPLGGWNDFQGSYDTPEEAYTAAIAKKEDWQQIVDSKNGEKVAGM